MRRIVVIFFAALVLLAADKKQGEALYKKHCVDCHGEKGEGVPEEYDSPLTGDASLAKLKAIIHKTMPEQEPKAVRDGDAEAVAAYIYDAFYSREAWQRLHPARIELSLLTVRQYETVMADLVGSFTGAAWPGEARGLQADYCKDRLYRRHVFSQLEPQVEVDFGKESPLKGHLNEEDFKKQKGAFAVRWSGSILAEETGDYEFVVRTQNGFRLWINDMENAIIDGFVAPTDGKPADQRTTIRLLGGRAYPVALEHFRFKEPTAGIRFSWRPPHGAEQVIPTRNLSPVVVPPVFVLAHRLPPDDSSVGYPRGTKISEAWNEAAVSAALTTTRAVAQNFDTITDSRDGAPNRAARLRVFAGEFAERAFRRPLTAEEQETIVDARFEATDDAESACKQAMIRALTAPQFLYAEIPDPKAKPGYDPTSDRVAARLALALLDSIPDAELHDAAVKDRLLRRPQVADQARRMLRDPRARAKLRSFFQHWLQMGEAEYIVKDKALFPGFDAQVVADLRLSLDLFVDDVVWQGDADFRQLLLANSMFVSPALARFYGVEHPGSAEFAKVQFPAERRAGILTHPYLLSTLAYHHASSPIHRGVFVTRNLLGRSLMSPQEAVEFEDAEFAENLTMREKISELTKPENCQGCHSVINPLGFTLEHFDAVGRFRTHEKDKPIDARTTFDPGDGKPVVFNSARELADFAVKDSQAQRSFIIQLFNHIAKQPIQAYGKDELDDFQERFQKSGFNIRDLALEMAILVARYDGG